MVACTATIGAITRSAKSVVGSRSKANVLMPSHGLPGATIAGAYAQWWADSNLLPEPKPPAAWHQRPRLAAKGLFLIYFGFSNGQQAGDVQIKEDGEGKRFFIDGEVYNIEREGIRVVDARHDIVFIPDTRVFETACVELDLENGETWRLKSQSIGRPWVFGGGGTDGGFFDGLGQGVYRSKELLTEVDIYDVTQAGEHYLPGRSSPTPKAPRAMDTL